MENGESVIHYCLSMLLRSYVNLKTGFAQYNECLGIITVSDIKEWIARSCAHVCVWERKRVGGREDKRVCVAFVFYVNKNRMHFCFQIFVYICVCEYFCMLSFLWINLYYSLLWSEHRNSLEYWTNWHGNGHGDAAVYLVTGGSVP